MSSRDQGAQGFHMAACNSTGVIDPDIREIVRDFRIITDVRGRAAYAHHWIGMTSRHLNDTWPMLYELLALVRDQELYRDPKGLGIPVHELKPYPSFEAYFEDRVKKPFARWAELEATYHFARDHVPELMKASFEEAKSRAQEAAANPNIPPKDSHGGSREGSGRNRAQAMAMVPDVALQDAVLPPDGNQVDVVNLKKETGGNGLIYLIRRLKRDAPEYAEALARGEYPSARAAALAAGILKPRKARRRMEVVTRSAETTTGDEALPADGTVHPGNASQFTNHTQASRAGAAGVSKRTQEKLDALARRAPDLMARVRAGEMTTHRACIEAGIVKVPTPLDATKKMVRRLTPEDRIALVQWLDAGMPE